MNNNTHPDLAYPTAGEADAASMEQLAEWHRHLPPPGSLASVAASAGTGYDADIPAQCGILNRIAQRLDAHGILDTRGCVDEGAAWRLCHD